MKVMMMVNVLTLVTVLLSVSHCSSCFHSLRRPPYETYWLGTYHDSRILSLSCFALRSFRWTLKFVKVTYESWHVEMEFAKCVSETYGMNIPFLAPPWIKHARAMQDQVVGRTAIDRGGGSYPMARHDPYFLNEPLSRKKVISLKDNSEKREEILDFKVQSWRPKNDVHDFITSLEMQPLFATNDRFSQSLIPKDSGSMEEITRIVKSLCQIFYSLFVEVETVLSKTLGIGIFTCSRKYIKNAFWRWVDSAPFLR